MEIRVLRYFIEIAREGNMTKAAESLHITQPTLSKQIKELELSLGKKLFIRGSTHLTLTDEGMLLRKRAEDILSMVDKTISEFESLNEITGGEVLIGCAESSLISHIAKVISDFKMQYPNFVFDITSGDTSLVVDKLDKGLLEFAIICELPDLSKYNYLELPGVNTWGLAIRKDHPLANHKTITYDDIVNIPLICSKQSVLADMPRWCGEKAEKLNFVGYTNLFYNGSIFAKENIAGLLTFNDMIDSSDSSNLTFIPLYPKLETKMYVIWKKYQIFTPIASLLLEELKKESL